MTWMRVTIPAGEINKGLNLEQEFKAAFMVAGAPKSAALFMNHMTEPDSVYYFSPGAVSIFAFRLSSLGAEKCEAPSAASTIFMIGHDEARHMLS